MARHFIDAGFPINFADRKPMPRDKYYGFAIGSTSEHGILTVRDVPGVGDVQVVAGGVVPITPAEFEPLISTVSDNQMRAHLIGLTCEAELAGSYKRAPYRYHEYARAQSAGVLVVPFHGRTHLAIMVRGSVDTMTFVVEAGLKPSSSSQSQNVQLLSQELTTANTWYAFHVGGDGDQAEPWDYLRLQTTGGAGSPTFDLDLTAGGEFGG